MGGCITIIIILLIIGIVMAILEWAFSLLKGLRRTVVNLIKWTYHMFIFSLPYIGIGICVITVAYVINIFAKNKYNVKNKNSKISFWLSIVAFIILGFSLINLKWINIFDNSKYNQFIEKNQISIIQKLPSAADFSFIQNSN